MGVGVEKKRDSQLTDIQVDKRNMKDRNRCLYVKEPALFLSLTPFKILSYSPHHRNFPIGFECKQKKKKEKEKLMHDAETQQEYQQNPSIISLLSKVQYLHCSVWANTPLCFLS